MAQERVVTVRMSGPLHKALKELVHSIRADSMNKLCVRLFTDAVLEDEYATTVLMEGLDEDARKKLGNPENPRTFPEPQASTEEEPPEN